MTDDKLVKKVAPYPIAAQVIKTEGQPPFKANILKLTDFGFLAKVDTSHYYKVGENYKIQFVLPLSETLISEPVKVIKTYDSMEAKTAAETTKMLTIEMHFLQIDEMKKTSIQHFLKKIGQKS